MKTTLILISTLTLAQAFQRTDNRETTRQSYPAATALEVDNLNGSIHVSGYNGSTIQVSVEKVIRADSPERADAAKREVTLDVQQSSSRLRLYVNGPFRDRDRSGSHEHPGYDVAYNFDIQAPVGTTLQLKTVNGKAEVNDVSGDFDISSVNGRIQMENTAGAGAAHTVNGKITAAFAQNPQKHMSFKTVNGSIEATFQPALSSDVQVKTSNGGVFTDFEAAAVGGTAPMGERRNGRFVYRSDQSGHFRIGSGGPELSFETLNGSIRILKQGQ